MSEQKAFVRWKEPGILGRLTGARATPVLTTKEPVWLVGRYVWKQREFWNRGDRDTYETGVTADGEIVPIGHEPQYLIREVHKLESAADITRITDALEKLAEGAEDGRYF